MLAHLCLMAWKEPIGRPNWTLRLAYSTDILEALLGASDRTQRTGLRQQRRASCANAASARPAVRWSRLVSTKFEPRLCRLTCGSGARTNFGALPSTAKGLTSASVRAATRSGPQRGHRGRRTSHRRACSRLGRPCCGHFDASKVHRALSSSSASVAMVSPLAMPGR